MAKRFPQLPAAPFSQWLQQRYEQRKRPPSPLLSERARSYDAARKLANEVGWADAKDATRKLYRYRNQLDSTSHNGVKGDYPGAVSYSRHLVEDALHYAGGTALFYEVYERYANERAGKRGSAREVVAFLGPFEGWVAIAEELEQRDAELEPEQFCDPCDQWTSPVDGICLWCGWPVDGSALGMAA